MTENEGTMTGNRIFFLDNLRTFIILLVVIYHAGWVYESSGTLSSVWIVDDPSKNELIGLFNLIIDMFVMPVMFFISGYFTPLSLAKKTGWTFLKSRIKRLMVPWLIAVLTLIPLYKVIFLYSRNLPPENLISYFYFKGEILINQGWLWFIPVLFLFDLLYFSLSKVNPVKLGLGLKGAVFTIFIVGFIYSFYMSFYNHYGWTKTILLDFQNERLLIYFMMFLLGALCYKEKVFNSAPTGKKLYYFICFTSWIPMNVYIIFLINIFVNPGNYIISGIVDVALIWLGFHLSLLSLLYIIINTFRYYLNRGGKIINQLNTYSYGVYIIHFIVLGGIALILLPTTLPALSKYVILGISTFAVSNLLMYIYKKAIRKIITRNAALSPVKDSPN
jgi:peptidoglycan/LPS O-acetylase OafA/YrhL